MVSEQFVRISYAKLANATNGFALENLIGAGSFGSVYKGRMRYNSQHVVIAAKVLNLMQRGASESFATECETLRCARHRNLVKILMVCSSIDFQGCDFKALVYEFLPNGNLDQGLHQSPIIHCDLKPSNVLLDNDLVAHVGDFGLARFLHQDTEKSSGWAAMRGSIGYAAPGVLLLFYNKLRVSYGILLLEMFTGKRPTDGEVGETTGLQKYVKMALPDRVSIILDQQLLPEVEDGEASTLNSSSNRGMRIACIALILLLGICCSEEMPMDRLPIEDGLRKLEAIRDKLHNHLSNGGASSNGR
ncbi:putative LRR receptor-like serine/threonine-protein kinase [Dichanthelium oligosanthes]|uniref:Putative LRR receptor-like serine/threonine-protein kinase n=1 Tax=Dichanthelium oligosanthes TaxID=888268 RepID=A0A1E5UVB1_9POAL|nr:putative LRR receptor-like serine/threonine-protein kinase [Dichanthelium oligosanthes]